MARSSNTKKRRPTRAELKLSAFMFLSDYIQRFMQKQSRPGFRMPLLEQALNEEIEPERLRLLAVTRNGGLDDEETR